MWQYNYTNELYHYGVKGMKWGVRKKYYSAATAANLTKKKRAYYDANKAYNRSFNNAYYRSVASLSPVKKHRKANEDRWVDAYNKAQALNKAQKEYKSAKGKARQEVKSAKEKARQESKESLARGKELFKKADKISLKDQLTIKRYINRVKEGKQIRNQFTDKERADYNAYRKSYATKLVAAYIATGVVSSAITYFSSSQGQETGRKMVEGLMNKLGR